MDDTNSLIEQRKAKLAALRAKGIDPFKNKFTPTETCAAARANYTEGREVALAGRITAHREMGKSQFIDIRDQSGRMQVYAQKNALGDEQWNIFTHLDLGDFIGVRGTLFTTKTGEISVKLGGSGTGVPPVRSSDVPQKETNGRDARATTQAPFTILAKALRPPPAKWHGLEDTEIRYRQRYLDLMGNPDVKDVFLKRSAIVHEIRSFFHSRGYVEVETPAMQAIPGGAAAQPFKTFHNALGCEFYLRIALELYHKRLLVGGIDKLFEIGKNFRNEGLSRRHNPEFTMLEAYQAFGDYETMMETVQSLICHVAQKVLGKLQLPYERPTDVQFQIHSAIDGLNHVRRMRIEGTPELHGPLLPLLDATVNELSECAKRATTPPSGAAAIEAKDALERFREAARTVFKNLGVERNHDLAVTLILLSQEIRQALQRLRPLCWESVDLTQWKRVRYRDVITEAVKERRHNFDWFAASPAERLTFAEHSLGVQVAGRPRRKFQQDSPQIEQEMEIARIRGDDASYANLLSELSKREEYLKHGVEDFEVTQAVFEELVEPTLIQPTFVTHLPKELVPLAKLSPDDPTTVEVFECCINGQEISPGYTEQNDPIAQRTTLEHQAGGEQQKLDEDFLVALEHGMPPAGGIGIGIDRLCMMLLGQESIRDVILFPQLKPK
ncbi:MAG: hypothetical protein KIS67_03815 [Verrucomicrobiae bacterium]|nr:hypothetical protein [Verrucomicrobiae bacterium]